MSKYNYGCVMLKVKHPDITKIQDTIDKNDIYNNEDNEFGLETESHITLLYGLEPEIPKKDVSDLLPPLSDFKLIGTKVSIFDNPEYDVLKIEVKGDLLNKTNKKLRDNLEYTSDFPDYKPHLTLAYLKKGTGKKYIKDMLDKIMKLEIISYKYNDSNTHFNFTNNE